jgi:DNA-directed RNA polymerase I, II, and III subunit RPABC5
LQKGIKIKRYINIKMIIPVLCVTCSNVIADKYRYYLDEVRQKKLNISTEKAGKVIYLTAKNTEKTIEGQVLDNMLIKNPCCRRHFLTHVDIE